MHIPSHSVKELRQKIGILLHGTGAGDQQSDGLAGEVPHLVLGDTPPKPGNEVILMGYQTGLKAMLAQTGDPFIEELQAIGDLDFWAVAARLAAAGFDEEQLR